MVSMTGKPRGFIKGGGNSVLVVKGWLVWDKHATSSAKGGQSIEGDTRGRTLGVHTVVQVEQCSGHTVGEQCKGQVGLAAVLFRIASMHALPTVIHVWSLFCEHSLIMRCTRCAALIREVQMATAHELSIVHMSRSKFMEQITLETMLNHCHST